MTWNSFPHDSPSPQASAAWRSERARGVSRECFADEIAIDFPSIAPVVDRIRDAFLGESDDDVLLAGDVHVSPQEAWRGMVVPLEVPVRTTCNSCGGRGETWTEPCFHCAGSGESVLSHPVRLALPPRVTDGARFRFRVTSPHATPVRVEIRVAIRTSAA